MPLKKREWVQRHRNAVACGAVLLVATIRYLLTPWLGNDAPFTMFTLPVLALAILVGTQPAIIAIVLAFLAGTFFVSRGGTLQSNVLQAVLFLIVASGIVWLATRFRTSHLQLAAADQHLRSILDTVPDAMIVVGADNRIISFSPAAERMFGTSGADVIGETFPRLLADVAQYHSGKHIAQFRQIAGRQFASTPNIMQARHADGSLFPIELSVGETVSAGQTLFTGFIRDLTAQKAAAARISRLQTRLDQVGRLGAMGTMASTLAHELNQPIMAVAAYLRAARIQFAGQSLPIDIDVALDGAEAEAMRAGNIIRHLRDYVARGEVEQTIESLLPLIREAVNLVISEAGNNGVTIDYACDPATPQVMVNRVQLQQVLINLIRNAVEAMAATPEKRLTLATGPDGPGHVRVTIRDTGPGIAADIAERLFEAFTTTKPSGLGLGLPISRTIIEANGGRIWAVTDTPSGSEFHISLNAATVGAGDAGLADA